MEKNGMEKIYNRKGELDFELKRMWKRKRNYNNGKLKYEGEYLNGERNGKGKEYWYDGTLIFEGEYLNGKKLEKPKKYDDNAKQKENEY